MHLKLGRAPGGAVRGSAKALGGLGWDGMGWARLGWLGPAPFFPWPTSPCSPLSPCPPLSSSSPCSPLLAPHHPSGCVNANSVSSSTLYSSLKRADASPQRISRARMPGSELGEENKSDQPPTPFDPPVSSSSARRDRRGSINASRYSSPLKVAAPWAAWRPGSPASMHTSPGCWVALRTPEERPSRPNPLSGFGATVRRRLSNA